MSADVAATPLSRKRVPGPSRTAMSVPSSARSTRAVGSIDWTMPRSTTRSAAAAGALTTSRATAAASRSPAFIPASSHLVVSDPAFDRKPYVKTHARAAGLAHASDMISLTND